jgi:tetratricopeptide (TPR) repeat protein
VALNDDTVVLAVGGWPGQPYRPLPWEPIYLAQASMRSGDWRAAAQILECEAGEHRHHAFVRFQLARCHARLGQYGQAIEELRAAIEARPELRERAARSDDLEPLRGREGSPLDESGS